MAPIISTPLVSIVATDIQDDWTSMNVLPSTLGGPLALFMYLTIDPSLYGNNQQFTANFAFTDVATGQRFNNYWIGNLDGLPNAPEIYVFMTWPTVFDAGIRQSGYSFTGMPHGDGLYVYRPSFAVQVPEGWSDFGPGFVGWSQYAVSEEHYFLVESSW